MAEISYPQSIGTERELLDAHLEFAREMVIQSIEGISKEDGVKRLGPSATSLLGVLRHLTEVQYWWFQDRFAGIPYTDSRSSEEDRDGEFKIREEDTVESLIAGFNEACENSRLIVKDRSLDDLAAHARPRDNKQPSLRWVYLHMIDELARHSGHLQIYREILDAANEANSAN